MTFAICLLHSRMKRPPSSLLVDTQLRFMDTREPPRTWTSWSAERTTMRIVCTVTEQQDRMPNRCDVYERHVQPRSQSRRVRQRLRGLVVERRSLRQLRQQLRTHELLRLRSMHLATPTDGGNEVLRSGRSRRRR
jgi:hypothetical protein